MGSDPSPGGLVPGLIYGYSCTVQKKFPLDQNRDRNPSLIGNFLKTTDVTFRDKVLILMFFYACVWQFVTPPFSLSALNRFGEIYKHQGKYTVQWRIQNFPASTNPGEWWAPTYYLINSIFPENCIKMNQLWPRMGGGGVSSPCNAACHTLHQAF